MCFNKSPEPDDGVAATNASAAAVKAQTAEQYEMDMMTALMSAGKIPAMNVTDPVVRNNFKQALASMDIDISNPFPNFIKGVGETLIEAINRSAKDFNYDEAFAKATEFVPDLINNVKVAQEELNKLYGDGPESVQAYLSDNLKKFKEYNAGMAKTNLDEAAGIVDKQNAITASGNELANSIEGVGSGTAGLLNEQLDSANETSGNVLSSKLTGNENVFNETVKSGDNIADSIAAGATSVLDTATNVAGNIEKVAGEGLKAVSDASLSGIEATKNQDLSGIGSVADVKTDALGTTTDTATTGLEDVANVATTGVGTIRDTEKTGLSSIYDADISASQGIRDVSLGNAAGMEGAQLGEAGILGNQMRRTAMTGRRAAEDAYNQSLRGMRTQGIGQGTGSNMRSAFSQNRANQAQEMFAPMAHADATQLGMESQARLGRIGTENQANLDFEIDKGMAGSQLARNVAGADNKYASSSAGINNQEAEGLAGVRLADAVGTGEIDTEEAIGTAGALSSATNATGANNVNLASGLAAAGNTNANAVGAATNAKAGTIAGADTANVANTGQAGISKAGADAAANTEYQGSLGENDINYINRMIEEGLQRDRQSVSANEIRLGNDLRKMGWSDAEIQAIRQNLGYELSEQDMLFNNFQQLMNQRIGNAGMNANQASLMKYLNSAPYDMALGGMDAISRYASPYTQRTLAPSHQSYINTAPYIPQSQGGGGGGGFFDNFVKYSNMYKNLPDPQG